MLQETAKILLVEDNPPDVRSLERLLAVTLPGGSSLRHARTLQAGLEVLRTEEIDVVLLDLGLPDCQGFETLEAVRHQANEVAIVVLSGNDDDSLAERAMELGVQDYLVKGEARGNKLIRTIRYAIQRKYSLRASQARNAAIMESALDCIISMDAEGRVFEFNPAAEKTFGYRRSNVVGRPLDDLIIPQDPGDEQAAEPGFFRRMEEKQMIGRRMEISACRSDGQRLTVELAISLNPVENPPSFTAFLRDITERKREEEELRWKTAFLEALVGSATDGMMVVDEQQQKIIQNQQFSEMWRIPEHVANANDVEQQILWAAGMARDPAHFIRRVHELYAHPDESSQEEIELINGRVLDRQSAPVIGQDGRYFGRIWTYRDITARKRTEESLRQSEARYERIAANVPGMVHQFVIRADGSYAFPFVSDACREIYGLEPEQMLANADLATAMTHPEDKADLESALAESASTLQPLRWEGRIVRPDTGEIRCIQAASRPERQANGDVIWDGVVVDVTSRKQAEKDRHAKEEAERANDAKSEFLSRMSHELRTPLNAILGFGQLLELDAAGEKQQESVHQIISGGRHLLKLVDEVLDIAGVDSGRISLSPEAVALDELVRETVLLIGPLASQRGIGLHVHPLEGRESHVTADRHRLKQVLLNLLGNAVKYNVPGGRVTVDYESSFGRLRLRIADTGPGIAEEMRQRLFTPFDRLGAESTNVEGTGLGLALSKRLVDAMGGDLRLEPTPIRAAGDNAGAVFWLEFPLAADPLDALADPGVKDLVDTPAAEPFPAGRCVLYIEDNLSNLRLVERLLEAHPDVRLLTATHGGTGLGLVAEHSPDLILLDLHLPDMNGKEVLARLRAEERTREIPVIVVSADATAGQIERLQQAGAYAYITKPLDVARFSVLMRQALQERNKG